MDKTALIYGITGQDGSYLAELLLEKGYSVYGVARRVSTSNTQRIQHLFDNNSFHLLEGDVTDSGSVFATIQKLCVDELYNLSAMSHVGTSFEQPYHTFMVDALGELNILEALRLLCPHTRHYFAGSSEQFGNNFTQIGDKRFQNENTPFAPASPYAAAKVASHHLVRTYRESYSLHASVGILFNHESPRRGDQFVTKKIINWLKDFIMWTEAEDFLCESDLVFEEEYIVSSFTKNKFPKLRLGNLNASRDWGFAGDYCFELKVPILTIEGWKFYDEIKDGDIVINFDTKNNCLSRDIIKRKFLLKNKDLMIRFTGRGLDLKVTQNHRIIYQQKSKNSHGGWSDWKECTAAEFYKKFKNISMRTKYDYRLPHFQDYDYKNVSNKYDVNMVYLVGLLLSEGSLTPHSHIGQGINVSLSQSKLVNENIYEKIKQTISNLNLTAYEVKKNNGVVEWRFSRQSSDIILSWFDKPNIHQMPKWCYDLDCELANVLVGAMMDGDGHWGGMIYSSKRYQLAVDFQSIATIAGYRTTGIKRNGVCYTVCMITKRKKYLYVVDSVLEKSDSEDVWCVETNNGTIVTRDNDCINVSGNCKAMWLMLQQSTPDDYVIATGETYTVRDFLREAFAYAGISNYNDFIVIDKQFCRPNDVEYLCGRSTKAMRELGWFCEVGFKDLIHLMFEGDNYVQKAKMATLSKVGLL